MVLVIARLVLPSSGIEIQNLKVIMVKQEYVLEIYVPAVASVRFGASDTATPWLFDESGTQKASVLPYTSELEINY